MTLSPTWVQSEENLVNKHLHAVLGRITHEKMPALLTKFSRANSVDLDNAMKNLEVWTAANRPDVSDKACTRHFDPVPIGPQSTSISEDSQPRNKSG